MPALSKGTKSKVKNPTNYKGGVVGRTWKDETDPKITASISIRESVWTKAKEKHGRKLSAKIEGFLELISK